MFQFLKKKKRERKALILMQFLDRKVLRPNINAKGLP